MTGFLKDKEKDKEKKEKNVEPIVVAGWSSIGRACSFSFPRG